MNPIKNKRAGYDFFIEEEEVAGMVLTTPEVKAIASGLFSIAGSYVKFINGEAFLLREQGNSIKLLLTKKQINRFIGKVNERGYTVVALEVFAVKGLFKLKVGLAKGKKEFDKRETEKKRTIDNNLRQTIKSQKMLSD